MLCLDGGARGSPNRQMRNQVLLPISDAADEYSLALACLAIRNCSRRLLTELSPIMSCHRRGIAAHGHHHTDVIRSGLPRTVMSGDFMCTVREGYFCNKNAPF